MNKKINREMLLLSILTLFTVLTWIGYDIYTALTKYSTPKVLKEQMKPLNPKINRAKIEKLKERLNISQEELEKVVVPKIITPEIVPESTESATSSGGV